VRRATGAPACRPVDTARIRLSTPVPTAACRITAAPLRRLVYASCGHGVACLPAGSYRSVRSPPRQAHHPHAAGSRMRWQRVELPEVLSGRPRMRGRPDLSLEA